MDNNLGIYICSGCDIGKSLNVERLINTAKDSNKPLVCVSHEFLCGPEGINLIKNDISEKKINKLVIAACSMRAKQDVFNEYKTVFVYIYFYIDVYFDFA